MPSDAHITGQDLMSRSGKLHYAHPVHFISLHWHSETALHPSSDDISDCDTPTPPLPSISHAGTTMARIMKGKKSSHGDCVLGPRCSRQYAGKGQKEGILMV